MTNKPKTIKDKERLLSGRIEGSWTYEMMETGWNACQASMQAQLDEKDAEIESLKEGMRQLRAIAKDDFKAREIISKYFPSKHSEVL